MIVHDNSRVVMSAFQALKITRVKLRYAMRTVYIC